MERDGCSDISQIGDGNDTAEIVGTRNGSGSVDSGGNELHVRVGGSVPVIIKHQLVAGQVRNNCALKILCFQIGNLKTRSSNLIPAKRKALGLAGMKYRFKLVVGCLSCNGSIFPKFSEFQRFRTDSCCRNYIIVCSNRNSSLVTNSCLYHKEIIIGLRHNIK